MPDFICLDANDRAILVIEAHTPEEAIAHYRHCIADEGKPKLARVLETGQTAQGQIEEAFAFMGPEKAKLAAEGRGFNGSLFFDRHVRLADIPRVRASIVPPGSERRLAEIALDGATKRITEACHQGGAR